MSGVPGPPIGKLATPARLGQRRFKWSLVRKKILGGLLSLRLKELERKWSLQRVRE